MLGLISRVWRGRAHTPARELSPEERLLADLAERKRRRLAKPERNEWARYLRARPMTERLIRERGHQLVDL